MQSTGIQQVATTLRSTDVRALMGSACLWAWIGSLYASSFFAPFGAWGPMPELATWVTFGFVVLLSALCLPAGVWVRHILAKPAALVASGLSGTVGSLLFALAAYLSSWAIMLVGALLNGLFMTFSIMAWGAVYCSRGTQSAGLYVAGGFACALLPQLLFMLMAPPASAIAPAALPLLANLFLLAVPAPDRTYAVGAVATPARRAPTLGAAIRRSLGISVPAVCALALIMLGLGYMQHQISFAGAPAPDDPGVFALPLVRSLSALVIFVVTALNPRHASLAYRVGLLAIVAGFSLMPFLYGTSSFWVAGATITAGYATFDVLVWVLIAQVAYTRLSDPLRVVCVVRVLITSLFCALGGIVGIVLSGIGDHAPFAYADAVLVGYLMTIAVVLVLSSPAVWELFDARPPVPESAGAPSPSPEAALGSLAHAWGLTERESEVFSLLAKGRTQPWVAENLGISESTVNSHVRHIYGKAGVNSRQELLDLVLSAQAQQGEDEETNRGRAYR